jgi:predicted TIM-barrel fold metal-dependent hydrolase
MDMSSLEERVHAGLPLDDLEIVDMHAHLGPHYNMHIPANTAADMIHVMDLCGIRRTVLSANLCFDADIVAGNDMMLEAVASYAGRLYGACAVNGNYPDLSLAELERCFARPGVVSIKVHPWYTKCALNDHRMRGIYAFAEKRRLAVLAHTWLDGDPYGSMDLFAAIAREYPGIRWIMGHSGGPYGSRLAVEIAREVPNVFLDIALSMCPARQIEFFVEEVGSERILFGTDNPFIDPRPQIGRVGLAEIPHRDKINIFGENARKCLGF